MTSPLIVDQPLAAASGSILTQARARRAVATRPATWRARAIAAYERAEDGLGDRLRADLADRVTALTGSAPAPASIAVDVEARAATVFIGGVGFRLRRGELVVLRPCGYCGRDRFESLPIVTLAELGHALAVWEPRCQHCPAEDPPEW